MTGTNAIELLRSDHRKLGALLAELAATTRASQALTPDELERVGLLLTRRKRELIELL